MHYLRDTFFLINTAGSHNYILFNYIFHLHLADFMRGLFTMQKSE